jgi:Zn finger protein HypA/HybF involved in hydrogenase expression
MWRYCEKECSDMKTSGFREIDFTKIECKNCGMNGVANVGTMYFCETGKIPRIKYTTKPFSIMPEVDYIDCPKCNGTGYTDETGTELELEFKNSTCEELPYILKPLSEKELRNYLGEAEVEKVLNARLKLKLTTELE